MAQYPNGSGPLPEMLWTIHYMWSMYSYAVHTSFTAFGDGRDGMDMLVYEALCIRWLGDYDEMGWQTGF